MKRIALIGANSQICKDFIRLNAVTGSAELLLFVRNVEAMNDWLTEIGFPGRYPVFGYSQYAEQPHDAVINFVGVGDPSRAALMGADILDVTLRFDELILAELKKNPERRYIFISSGAVYGERFDRAASKDTVATYSVNSLGAQNYYAIAKLHVEMRHRALTDLAIIDVRVFNYFSRHQSLESRFFIVDAVNSITFSTVFRTSPDHMERDFLHPSDFYQLISCLLAADPHNTAVDCYSAAPVEKKVLLTALSEQFGLRYEIVPGLAAPVNATGIKAHYYSTYRKAADFGYEPQYSSLDTLRVEISALLSSVGKAKAGSDLSVWASTKGVNGIA